LWGKDSGRRAARALHPGAVGKGKKGREAFFASSLTRANPQIGPLFCFLRWFIAFFVCVKYKKRATIKDCPYKMMYLTQKGNAISRLSRGFYFSEGRVILTHHFALLI
jgi:hypothetical protein